MQSAEIHRASPKAGTPWQINFRHVDIPGEFPERFNKHDGTWPLQDCWELGRGGMASHLHPCDTGEAKHHKTTSQNTTLTTLLCKRAKASRQGISGAIFSAVHRHHWLKKPLGNLVKDPNSWILNKDPSPILDLGGNQELLFNKQNL